MDFITKLPKSKDPVVTTKEGVAGYLYSQCPPNLKTRLTGQGDHVQGSRDLHGTRSHD